jgi:hypothetical protein
MRCLFFGFKDLRLKQLAEIGKLLDVEFRIYEIDL